MCLAWPDWRGDGTPASPSPWGPLAPSLSLSLRAESLIGMLKPISPALLQGDLQFSWGPCFPIVAFRGLSIIAHIIFSSPWIINSLRSADILPSPSLSLSPSLPTTSISHSSFLVESFAKWLPQLVTCACLYQFPSTFRGNH